MTVKASMQTVSLVKFKVTSGRPQTDGDARKMHFIRRFRERVGYTLSKSAYDELLRDFCVNSKFLYKNKDIGSVYAFVFRGVNLRVVYDAFKQHLITVLPPVIDFKGKY